jgi:hypothetical protein
METMLMGTIRGEAQIRAAMVSKTVPPQVTLTAMVQ